MGLSLTTFVQLAKLRATQASTTPLAICQAIALGQFTTSITNGRTVIETAEAGGMVKFEIPQGISPAEVTELAAKAIRWIEAQPNPANPAVPRPIRRLRATFNRAIL